MQILGKRSKVLLTVLCAVMLIAVGISFAAWDGSTVKADSGNINDYANAKVGDIVTFGKYYDYEKDANGNYVEGSTVIDKYPMTWIVVDKNERTGQLTLMSQYIIACGSFFGNYYYNAAGNLGHHYNTVSVNSEVAGIPYNQAYCDSTVRAYLNNLERLDMGGDQFVASNADKNIVGGYVPSGIKSTTTTGLLASIGYSNQRYRTGLTTASYPTYSSANGFARREDASNINELYYRRPLNDVAYVGRPAAKGFYDEAFTDTEKAVIIPKTIGGYTGFRWPDKVNDVSARHYVEGTVDKVWIPSVTELNIMKGKDWNGNPDTWTSASDESSSTVFEYFKNFSRYKNPYNATKNNASLENALAAKRTNLATDGIKGNYSIPVYDYQTTTAKTDIGTGNTSNYYWTRSSASYWYTGVRRIDGNGLFSKGQNGSGDSEIGVRPCIILQY